MKKALALILVAALAFTLVTTAAADAVPISDSKWSFVEGTDASMYTINADGSVAVSYRVNGVTYANCAILFDASAYGSTYDVSVKVKLPAKVGEFLQGSAAVSVRGNVHWTDGCSVKLMDLSNHPTASALGCCFELWDTAATVTPFDAMATYADANISATGWNDVKFEVRGSDVTIYINGTKIAEHTMAANGSIIALGTNGDSGDADVSKMTTFKDFKIAKTDGSKTYTAFGASGGNSNGPADAIDVVAVASVLVVSLLAVAFVMKARKA